MDITTKSDPLALTFVKRFTGEDVITVCDHYPQLSFSAEPILVLEHNPHTKLPTAHSNKVSFERADSGRCHTGRLRDEGVTREQACPLPG